MSESVQSRLDRIKSLLGNFIFLREDTEWLCTELQRRLDREAGTVSVDPDAVADACEIDPDQTDFVAF